MASYFFGIIKADAVVVPLSYRYSIQELCYCLNIAECKVLFSDIKYQELINKCLCNIKKVPFCVFIGNVHSDLVDVNTTFDDLLKSSSPNEPSCLLNSENDAAIYFTSGTTGRPKAVLLSHGNLEVSVKWQQKNSKQTFEDIFLIIPLFYHLGAMAFWFDSLLFGGKSVLLKNSSPQQILETISKEKISAVWFLLPWIQEILEAVECKSIELKKYDLSCWNVMNMAAQSYQIQ